MSSRWNQRFFASTRGQVVLLLRRGAQTVDRLAKQLGLTDNAVRAHLAGLERDGLVEQGDVVRGVGKPAFTYRLTDEAERLFPKAYGTLLHELLSVLSDRLPPDELRDALRDVGHRLAAEQPAMTGTVRQRVGQASALLGEIGGDADVEEATDGCFLIKGRSCPLAAAVEANTDACYLAEALIADLVGVPVRQVCDPGPPPRCHFEILAGGESALPERARGEGSL